jgi:uncharacterized membrane protein YeaQ/YmgE (transglycosylase-associated protein family)/uncharacterized protein YjbJ (UPF0337 family)
MNPLIWLLAGAAMGGLVTAIIRNRRKDLSINIAVGMAGAFVVGNLIPPILHFNPVGPGIFNLPAGLVSVVGAGIVLAVVNFFRRQTDVKNSVIERKWEQVRIKIHTRWGSLTDQDISRINSHHDQFNVTLQERYHISKNEAEDQIQRFIKAVLT